MTDFKEQMIRNIERGFTSPSRAYEFTRDQALDAADMARTLAKEASSVQPDTPSALAVSAESATPHGSTRGPQ